jgi:uncharacterized membrane protein
MEAIVVLVVLGALAVALVAPILAIVALVRASRLTAELRSHESRLKLLERRIEGLSARRAPAEAQLSRAAAPEPEPLAAPATVGRVAGPEPAERTVPAPVEVETPVPKPEGPKPPAPRVPPPRPAPPAPPPPPPREPFEWEGLLGIRGAAWIGAIAFVIAGFLFARWAIEEGLVTPELRIALMLTAGVGALLGAELCLRKGYETTANAVSGAGIAILYAAFFAAHSLYGLIPVGVAFAFMALVTVVATVLAVRYDAAFTAVLGLLGGFATPLALSTGVDRPIGLFSYILLLNVGILSVALRKRWHGLVALCLAGTLVIELGWFGAHMAPHKMLIGIVAFLVFGLVFLLLPLLIKRGQEERSLLGVGALGGVAPFLFAVLLAGDPRYASQWPLLFLFIGLLSSALAAVALLRDRAGLLLSAATAVAITLPLWAGQGLTADNAVAATLAALAIVAILNSPGRLARRLDLDVLERNAALAGAGLVAAAGLGLFGLVMVGRDLGEPPWAFLLLVAGLTAIVAERSGGDRLPGVALLGPLALGVLAQMWFFRSTDGETLVRNLAVPLLLSAAFSLISASRGGPPDRSRRDEDEGGVVGSALLAVAGLFACLVRSELGRDPWPLLAALAVGVALVVVSALRRGWTELLPVALALAALHLTLWQVAYFHAGDISAVLVFGLVFYLGFLALPFAMDAAGSHVSRLRRMPWITSALAGPLVFYPVYRAVSSAWGTSVIGVLPLLMAAVSVLALDQVSRRFPEGEARQAGDRLRWLSLFAAVALWFVALAVPIQLDRQWITIGWALEGVAALWLFGRLPHPGLRLFGAALYSLVGVRLLLNPEVLRYEERGLPILNWLLYTYGLPIVCCFVGAWLLRRAEAGHAVAERPWPERLSAAIAFLGLLLIFWLINLEILHFFSKSRHLTLELGRESARDLTLSVAWGLYALALLVVGLRRRVRALRLCSLAFLVLTVAKVFLYDLAHLHGIARVLSFLGLGMSLVVVSLLYQRFVSRKVGS